MLEQFRDSGDFIGFFGDAQLRQSETGPKQPTKVDAGLVDAISRARRWLHQLNTEAHPTIASLARDVDVDDGEISRILPLAFLAPDIVEAIVEGRQPVELTVRKLTRLKPFPARWTDQRLALGFSAI